MPPITAAKLERVYELLAEREYIRAQYSHLTRPSPEQVFYSVRNSLKNRLDNRYSNILAYDRTSVVVDGQYLNANLVTDGKGGEWIAAQAPPPRAFGTFFKALYTGAATGRRPASAIVVQLTGWEENGMLKADPYLPEVEHDVGEFKLRHESRRDLPQMATVLSELKLIGDRTLPVYHYHFSAWPDHGVPRGEAVTALGLLIEEIRRRKEEFDCEVWVHCSAGVGRTGTFIALSSSLNPGNPSQPSPLGPLPAELSADRIALTVDTIRECRGMLVQNIEQLRLIYDMQ